MPEYYNIRKSELGA